MSKNLQQFIKEINSVPAGEKTMIRRVLHNAIRQAKKYGFDGFTWKCGRALSELYYKTK